MDNIILSSWGDRFWAWLIDILLICILWQTVAFILEPEVVINYAILLPCMLFVYWTAMEGYRGQSVGKMVINIAVVGPFGEKIRFIDAAIESFGKAFVLPIDCLVCWLYFRDKRQRLFNKISNTLVIKQIEYE